MLTHLTHQSLAFLGPIGGPEIIMILVVLFLLVIPGALIVAVVLYLNRKKTPPPIPPAQSADPQSTQARLLELDSLKSQNLISEAEYEEERKRILGGL